MHIWKLKAWGFQIVPYFYIRELSNQNYVQLKGPSKAKVQVNWAELQPSNLGLNQPQHTSITSTCAAGIAWLRFEDQVEVIQKGWLA